MVYRIYKKTKKKIQILVYQKKYLAETWFGSSINRWRYSSLFCASDSAWIMWPTYNAKYSLKMCKHKYTNRANRAYGKW